MTVWADNAPFSVVDALFDATIKETMGLAMHLEPRR